MTMPVEKSIVQNVDNVYKFLCRPSRKQLWDPCFQLTHR